jgi:hypothetical protein
MSAIEEWIAWGAAVELVGDASAVLSALKTGAIRSRGRKDYCELEPLPADLWTEWSFLPLCKAAGSMQRFCWLVPKGTETRRVCDGYGALRFLREDVERAAERLPTVVSMAPAPVSAVERQTARKEALSDIAARALERALPQGRGHRSKPELARLVCKELGLNSIAPRTIGRALTVAWQPGKASLSEPS